MSIYFTDSKIIMSMPSQNEHQSLYFIYILFNHYRRPSGIEGEFFVQLFVDSDGNSLPSTQSLLNKMFLEQRISFDEVSGYINKF